MNPILTRVDSRLVHGTILETWVNYLQINTLLVANDEIINNGLQLTVLELAVPPTINLGIYSLKVAAQKFIDKDFCEEDRAILLFENIKDAFKTISYGLKIDSLNLGDYHSVNGTIKLSDRVVINEEDLELLKKIILKGVFVFVQCLPKSKQINLGKWLSDHK